MAAFALGASHGYRMFECDVKLSHDGVPFLIHDAELDRTTNGKGVAGGLPWGQLSRLDAGGWHSRRYAGEPLPTLENIARFCLANGHTLNIEIKPTPGTGTQTGTVVANHAALLWKAADVPPLLTSFDPLALQAAQQAQPNLPRGLLLHAATESWLTLAQQLGCVAIVCNHVLWNTQSVGQAKQAGMRCLSYTVNDAAATERLLALATDGIITDRVDLFAPG